MLLHLNVVQLVAGATTSAGNASAAGVLLGRTEDGKQVKLIVEGYEAATPEHGALESPFKDRKFMASLLERWRLRRGRMSILGFYRTCGKEGAALSGDDLKTVARSTETSRGSDCDLGLDQELSTGATKALCGGAVAMPGPAGAAETNLPGKDSERIFLMIEPRGAQGANGSFYLIRNSTVMCQSPRIPFNRTDVSRIGCVRQAPGSSIQDIDSQESKLVPEPARYVPPSPVLSAKNNGKATNRGWPVAVVALIGILGFSLFRMSGLQVVSTSSAHAESQNERQIGLQVERKGTDWEITWDRASYVLRQAKTAHLRITDDFIRKDIELSPSDLRNSRILYSPTSDDLVVTMEAESGDPANNARETVRLVAGLLPTPPVAGARDAERSGDPRRNPVPPAKSSSARTYFTRDHDASSESATRRATSGKRPSSPGNTTAIKPSTEPLWDLTESTRQAAVFDSALVLSALPGESLGSTAKQPELPPVNQELSPIGGNAVPAELILRVNPIYPDEAKSKKVEGNVEVQFMISREGAVKDLSVIKGDPVLAQATVQAVRGWRYKPAQLNGSPTEVQGKVVVNFKLN